MTHVHTHNAVLFLLTHNGNEGKHTATTPGSPPQLPTPAAGVDIDLLPVGRSRDALSRVTRPVLPRQGPPVPTTASVPVLRLPGATHPPVACVPTPLHLPVAPSSRPVGDDSDFVVPADVRLCVSPKSPEESPTFRRPSSVVNRRQSWVENRWA